MKAKYDLHTKHVMIEYTRISRGLN